MAGSTEDLLTKIVTDVGILLPPYQTKAISHTIFTPIQPYSTHKQIGETKHMVSLSAGSSAARSYPVSLVLSSGYNWQNGTYYTYHAGIWWTSSSVYSSSEAYELWLTTDHILTQDPANRLIGRSLRCVNSSMAFLLALALLVVIRCPWCCREVIIGIRVTVHCGDKILLATSGNHKLIRPN